SLTAPVETSSSRVRRRIPASPSPCRFSVVRRRSDSPARGRLPALPAGCRRPSEAAARLPPSCNQDGGLHVFPGVKTAVWWFSYDCYILSRQSVILPQRVLVPTRRTGGANS